MFTEALFTLVLTVLPQVLANLISNRLIEWIHKENK